MQRRLRFPSPAAGERAAVACPGCGAVPQPGTWWACRPDGCGAAFDTFATHGRCPSCGAQFPWTQCPACRGRFAHLAWYHAAG